MSTELQAVRNSAADIIQEAHGLLTDSLLPSGVVTAYAEYVNGIRQINASADKLADDMEELESKKILLPPAGYQHLASQARDEAKLGYEEGLRDAQNSMQDLQRELSLAALPKMDAGRESLAREELTVALSQGGGTVSERALHVAANGSREAAAALFSPYGTTLIESLGADPGEVLAPARAAAINKSATDGNPAEQLASQAYQSLGKLGAAIGGSATYFSLVADA